MPLILSLIVLCCVIICCVFCQKGSQNNSCKLWTKWLCWTRVIEANRYLLTFSVGVRNWWKLWSLAFSCINVKKVVRILCWKIELHQTLFFFSTSPTPGKPRQHECDIDLFPKCTKGITRGSEERSRAGQVPGKQSRRWLF